MSTKFDRRDFLELTGLGGLGLYAAPLMFGGCNREGPQAPFGVWEEMITALEQSPDHLPGRRKALVAAGDPLKMIEFVRDSFQLLPDEFNFLRNSDRLQGFGKKSALRCGWATPMEKAELLRDMLIEANYEAKIILENLDITEEDAKNIAFRSYRQEFDPPISKRQLRIWRDAMGATTPNGRATETPMIEDRSKTLADTLLGSIMGDGDQNRVKTRFFISANKIPSVQYLDGGIEKYGHVFDPLVEAGKLHPANREQAFKIVDNEVEFQDDDISVVVNYEKLPFIPRGQKQELVSATWKLSELAGNTVHLLFMNNMDFKQQASSSVSDITDFTPCLAYQNIHADRTYMEERSVVGEPIDLSGDPIINENLEGQSPEPSPNGKTVVDLELSVVPKVFPKVQLEVYPKDAQGNIVQGLTTGNFLLSDNEKPVVGIMKKNEVAPKFMIMYDTSLSMPMEYREEPLKIYSNALESAIRTIFPKATIDTQKTDSRIYGSLLRAKQTDADLILYATDGDNSDKYDPDYKMVYDSGPPAIFLNVTKQGSQNDIVKFRGLRENLDFREINATDQEATIGAIVELVKDMEFPPYVLTYNSFGEGEEHTIKVEMAESTVLATQKFRFPERNDNNIGQRILGVYLEIYRNKRRIVQRTLAGWNPSLGRFQPKREYIEDVHELFLGGAVLAFEREAPTLSVRLTDHLKTLLSNRAWFEAYQKGEIETAVEQLEKGVLSQPAQLLTMMQPLPNPVGPDHITFVKGFRTGVLKFKPGYYKTTSELSFDYLPTSNFTTVHRDGTEHSAFYENLKNSLQLSFLESEVFDHSALKDLEGRSLVKFNDVQRDMEFRERAKAFSPEFMNTLSGVKGTIRFLDESLTSDSYITVDPKSGEAYGMLYNGTGGGTNSIEAQLRAIENTIKEYQKVLAMINLLAMASGTGLAVGIVSAYSLTLVKLYGLASQALVLMDASGLEDGIREAMQELACNVYKEILFTGLGAMGKAGKVSSAGMGGVENLIALMGGEYSFVSCPTF